MYKNVLSVQPDGETVAGVPSNDSGANPTARVEAVEVNTQALLQCCRRMRCRKCAGPVEVHRDQLRRDGTYSVIIKCLQSMPSNQLKGCKHRTETISFGPESDLLNSAKTHPTPPLIWHTYADYGQPDLDGQRIHPPKFPYTSAFQLRKQLSFLFGGIEGAASRKFEQALEGTTLDKKHQTEFYRWIMPILMAWACGVH